MTARSVRIWHLTEAACGQWLGAYAHVKNTRSNAPSIAGLPLPWNWASLTLHIQQFDLDPKASFKLSGEQIDGAFTFQATDYLLEAKWQQAPVDAAALDSLAGKLTRKLDQRLFG